MIKEPVAIGAAVIAFCNAAIGVLGLIVDNLDSEVSAALNLLVVAAVGLVGAVVRSRVTPVEPRNPDVRSYYE